MKIAFRADASLEIGTGHVMRCLTLANVLSRKGHECFFLSRGLKGHLIEKTRQVGYACFDLNQVEDGGSRGFFGDDYSVPHKEWLEVDWRMDLAQTLLMVRKHCVDWLVVDHYALDARWESAIKAAGVQILAIDDLVDRNHACDILLDQTFGRRAEEYDQLVPIHSTKLCGSRFALLRDEFGRLREESLKRRLGNGCGLRRVLVTMGGVDKPNFTSIVLRAFAQFSRIQELEITVVMGGASPHLPSVQFLIAAMESYATLLVDPPNMAELMTQNDLCIGAAGSTSWERCCLGLPTILAVTAENQKTIAQLLFEAGAVALVKASQPIESMVALLAKMTSSELRRLTLSSCVIVDGQGAERVAFEIDKKAIR